VYIEDIAAHEGEEVTIKGWLYNKTDKGKLQFLLVRDGTGIIQAVVFEDDVSPEGFEAAKMVMQESSLIVTGTVRADRRAPGGYELTVNDVEIVQLAEDYPITPKEHGVEFLMDRRHLWLRSSRQHAVLRVRAEVVRAIRDWLDSHGFVNLDTPILTPSSCEDTTTLFETGYFGDTAYLTQSGQLYNEAHIMSFGKVYCFGPTFRAEKSKTRRHLLEFWMVEPEMAWADLDECMRVEEELAAGEGGIAVPAHHV
jgi:asparaginyl-tRNA synthetase